MLILIAGLITAGIMFLLLLSQGYAPFGNNTLAWRDADIQYLDFYAYYKDVLEGHNNLSYSFSKTLGGTNVAVFSYYLASPFCLLVLLFDKDDLQSFFDIVVVLKLTLSAMTCCYYLLKRFETVIRRKYQWILIVLLSMGYGLSQYNIAQSSNIMWLDGVYMLPLMLLEIYRIVKRHDKGWRLSVIVAYSIISNWYTAGINCVFSLAWLLLELLLCYDSWTDFGKRWKESIQGIGRYLISMVTGVMLSAALFLPTVRALRNSNRGSLNFNRLFMNFLQGKIPSFIQNFAYGSVSTSQSVALFCGNIALIGCISVFMAYRKNRYRTAIMAGVGIFGILMFYWNPLHFVFSLLKDATSYWFRYSYLAIFIMIFLAGVYYFYSDKCQDEAFMIPVKSASLFGVILFLFDYFNPSQDFQKTFKTVFVCLIMGIVLSILLYLEKAERQAIGRVGIGLCLCMLVGLSFYEMRYNASLLMKIYHEEDVDTYKQYRLEEEQQIAAIVEYDSDIYRITQTSTRNMGANGLTAYYNEALGYNYWSISGYTSSPDDIQRGFLDRLGYRECGENLCVVNTSILGADSLLGVKYVMSGYPIEGLKEIEELAQYNGKKVYENPYSLPMALTYSSTWKVTDESNPFVYQNDIYSQLVGEEVELYVPLQYDIQQTGDVKREQSLVYRIEIPDGNYAVYGNLPWNSEMDAVLNVNNKYETSYSCWLSPSVFYIPVQSTEPNVLISVSSAASYDMDVESAQFYALDLERLAEVTQELKDNNKVVDYQISNGYARINASAKGTGQILYVTIPYDKGWAVKRNGEKISTELVGNCMYSIPLVDGDNEIIMEYQIPYLKLGILISVIGVILLFVQRLGMSRLRSADRSR